MKISGFNNISKSLFVSFYRFCYALPEKNAVRESLGVLNDAYAAPKLSSLIESISAEIGACILLSSQQDYQPMGASAVALLAEEEKGDAGDKNAKNREEIAQNGENLDKNSKNHEKIAQNAPNSAEIAKNSDKNAKKSDEIAKNHYSSYTELCHLDKSHIALHTYPEANEQSGVCTFRLDLEVSTCGIVSPIRSLLTGMRFIRPDLVVVDYRQRGFTRDHQSGKRVYCDDFLQSVKKVLDAEILRDFDIKEDAMPERRLYFASLKKKKEVCWSTKNRYFLGKNDLKSEQMEKGFALLSQEMTAIEGKE